MSLNVRSGEGQLPTFVNVIASLPVALAANSAGVNTAISTSVTVPNVPGLALAKFNATAQNNQVVEVLNVPGRALAALIADPNFATRVFATVRNVPIGGTGVGHTVSAVNAPAWQSFTVPNFITGTASSWGFDAYDPPTATNFIIGTSGQVGVVNTSKVAELAARGITLNSAAKTLAYNGTGTAGSVTGVILEDIPTAEADWQSRTGQPGVVWFHDFRADAEVSNFRWTNNTGNDPNGTGSWGVFNGSPTVYRNPSVGITGGCLELLHPVGAWGSSSWWRPFSPLLAGSNGKATADPGDGGAITRRTWTPSQGSSSLYTNYTGGWYGPPGFSGSQYDGTDFYLQIRCRRDPLRFTGANAGVEAVGKHMFVSDMRWSNSDQELVTYSGTQTFRVYGGWLHYAALDQAPGAGGTVQPGGVSPLWAWAIDGTWDTVLIHIRPGRVGVNETLFEAYGAHQGQTSYTLFWQQTFVMESYDDDVDGRGYQAMIASTYINGASFPVAWREQWAQVIFSRQSIPCPQV